MVGWVLDDLIGRTTLDWATERVLRGIAVTLVEAGADPVGAVATAREAARASMRPPPQSEDSARDMNRLSPSHLSATCAGLPAYYCLKHTSSPVMSPSSQLSSSKQTQVDPSSLSS